MTIYEIKRIVKEKAPYFFDRKTMKFWGQTLKDFRVRKLSDRYYYIFASWRKPGFTGKTERIFDNVERDLLDVNDKFRKKYNLPEEE
jgi:hypothetical protein